jgi:hypothetical protein
LYPIEDDEYTKVIIIERLFKPSSNEGDATCSVRFFFFFHGKSEENWKSSLEIPRFGKEEKNPSLTEPSSPY